jgi:hypothetical protein
MLEFQEKFNEDSLKYYRDLKNSLDTAKEEGIEIGVEKVTIEMLKLNLNLDIICKTTKLTLEQIEQIKTKIENA